ncbi:hypothetical protein [Bradyrhizobium sp.]|uniref:hypothetical protein n=1 Tax=Bradyrhizobium sp. TaxID=376 RepID=UPI000A85FD91|nr:hypothetical protein [Bradyrhizobium sp.]
MSLTDTRSLQQLKRETEQARAGLTATVEQLKTSVSDTASDIRQRISPDSIKAEVSDYIRTRGEQLVNDVTAAARKNPMQAVAVGATLAYPLLRLARSIPVPVLMVGAGLFLAGSKTGQAVTQKASDVVSDLSEDLVRRAHDFRDQVGHSTSAAKAYASDRLDRASSAAASAQDAAVSLPATMASGAGNLRDQAVRMAGSAGDNVQDIASGMSSAARNAATIAADAGMDAARTVRDTASDLTDRAGKTVFQTIEKHPLVVAGFGLLIGGLIASALPRSDIEDDLIGETSDAVKLRAQDAASQGLNATKNAAGQVYDEATRLAEAEGLTPDGIGKAAQDIGQRVRRVAESAVTTAFEPDQANQPRNQGATDHG